MHRHSRNLHRAVVPIAAIPLMLTAISGIIFSILDKQGIEAEWLLAIHTGHFGPLDLSPFYSLVLGLCVLILVGSGASMWWRTHPRRHHNHQHGHHHHHDPKG